MAHTDDTFKVICYYAEGDPYGVRSRGITEPAAAVDIAETWLQSQGRPGESFAEIRLGGHDYNPNDGELHVKVFLMEDDRLGIWNTDDARWPVYYPPEGDGLMLDGDPFADDDDSGFGDVDEDADMMDLSNDGTEEEKDDEIEDDESEEDSGQDEEDDSVESEDDDDEPEDEELDEADEDFNDEGEDDTDEDDDGDEDDPESDSDEEGDDADSSDQEEADGNDEEDENGLDADGENETDDDSENEEEEEMPRLNIFAKMRGPKGWRKRAEREELETRNVFGFKLGVVNEDGETPAKQEQEVFAQVQFIEDDSDRSGGLLRMRLPDGITVENFNQTRSGWINVRVPYRSE